MMILSKSLSENMVDLWDATKNLYESVGIIGQIISIIFAILGISFLIFILYHSFMQAIGKETNSF